MGKNIFFTKFSELSGERYDPKYNDYVNKYKTTLENSVKLSSLLSENPKYGANESAVNFNGRCRYIRITDIDEYGLLKNNSVKSAKIEEDKYRLEVNDILFARSGATVGKTYIHKDKNLNAIFAGYMIRFRVDASKVNPNYIFYYTNLEIYKKWTEAIQRAAGQPNINAEEYQDLDIPIPPVETQNQIISIMDNAYNQKEQKEQEAKDKLASINKYLLGELGIKFKEKDKDKESLEKRIFTRKFREVSEERLDPLFYSGEVLGFFKKIIFNKVKLDHLTDNIDSGIGAGKNDQCSSEKGVLHIRPTNIDRNGCLKTDKKIYIPFNEKLHKIQENDVLFNNTNSQELVGKALFVDNEINAYYSNHITRIQVNKKIKAQFLWLILNFYQKNKIFYNICTNWNNQSGVGLDLLKNLPIPLPPLEIQNKIITHIQYLQDEAKALEQDAKKVYENAKKEVETIILNSDENEER